MKEYKPMVDVLIENLQNLSQALEEGNVPNACGYYVVSVTSFAMTVRMLEPAILAETEKASASQAPEPAQETEEADEFPEIID